MNFIDNKYFKMLQLNLRFPKMSTFSSHCTWKQSITVQHDIERFAEGVLLLLVISSCHLSVLTVCSFQLPSSRTSSGFQSCFP